MKIFHNIDELDIEKPIASIGIFDGVHLAHQSIIRELISTTRDLSGESVIITLWPHPRIVLNSEKDPVKLLNTLEEKIDRLKTTGIENLIIIPFNKELAQMGFDRFIQDVLLKKIHVQHLVVGYNHHFGHNREGNYEKLQELAGELGFGLSKVVPVLVNDIKVSSSTIRRLITEGKIEPANDLLGYPYYISGKVIRGNRKGRNIGFPTANMQVSDMNKLLPQKGVYAVYIDTVDSRFKGMMNIGCRPTFHDDCLQETLEVNLFDYKGDLYNEVLKIHFIKKIREEKKFETIDALRQQIVNDKQLVNKILGSIKMDKI